MKDKIDELAEKYVSFLVPLSCGKMRIETKKVLVNMLEEFLEIIENEKNN